MADLFETRKLGTYAYRYALKDCGADESGRLSPRPMTVYSTTPFLGPVYFADSNKGGDTIADSACAHTGLGSPSSGFHQLQRRLEMDILRSDDLGRHRSRARLSSRSRDLPTGIAEAQSCTVRRDGARISIAANLIVSPT